MTTVAGTVLYVEDHVRVSRFYREVLGFTTLDSGHDHTRITCNGFEMVVHAHSATPASTVPAVERRVNGAFRLIFAVSDVEACRTAAAVHGGLIDRDPPIWAGPDAVLRLGHDPEGNIFQLQPR